MANVINEGRHAGEFLVSEANGHRSREAIAVAAGQNLKAGAVIGKILVGAAVAAAAAGNTGNGSVGAVTVGAGAKAGVYRVTCIEPATNAGKFTIEDPDGATIGVATVAVEFAAGGLAFTIADGATDFAAGDAFTITVAAGSGLYKAWDPAAADGSQVAAAVLYAATDASLANVRAVGFVRDAEVNGHCLEWPAAATADQKAEAARQLAAAGILIRS